MDEEFNTLIWVNGIYLKPIGFEDFDSIVDELHGSLLMHRYTNDPEYYATDMVRGGNFEIALGDKENDIHKKIYVNVYKKTIDTTILEKGEWISERSIMCAR